MAPGTAQDCGTLSFTEQVPLDAEETMVVEKAGGGAEGTSRGPREQGPLGHPGLQEAAWEGQARPIP